MEFLTLFIVPRSSKLMSKVHRENKCKSSIQTF